jgi:hypothetical protein
VKKFFGSFAVLTAMTALMLGSATAASATHPDDVDCAPGLVVVCDIDVNVLNLEDPDVVVEIDEPRVITDNEVEVLENALKNADILNGLVIDVDVIEDVIIDVHKSFNPEVDIDVSKITAFLCAVQSHAHCN